MTVISIKDSAGQFLLRAAGILLWDGKVLLQEAKTPGSWVLPGGRNEIGESTADTVVREFQEELGLHVEIIRPSFIIENFHAYGNEGLHELGMYYLVRLQENRELTLQPKEFFGIEEGIKLTYRWFTPGEINDIHIYPRALKKYLLRVPEQFIHLVNYDK